MDDLSSPPTPLDIYRGSVLGEWIDYNGHMNVAYYVLAFDHATDAMLDFLSFDHDYKAANDCTTFIVDMNVTYKRELVEGDPLRVTTQIIDSDEKRLHYFHHMYHATDGYLAATNEVMMVHVDLKSRRVAPMSAELEARVRAMRDAHAMLPVPAEAGRTIGIRRR